MKKIMIFIMVVASLSGEDLEKVFYKGKSSAELLVKTLGKEMKKHLKKGDIKGAVEFCSSNALALTEQVSQKLTKNILLDKNSSITNISVKRISTKYRSPANKPTKTEAKMLFLLENNNAPLLTKVLDGKYKFYQPLRIGKPVCLKCHGKGEDMPEIARRTLHSIYPNDNATGYEFGDLRGAVVVTIKTDKEKCN